MINKIAQVQFLDKRYSAFFSPFIYIVYVSYPKSSPERDIECVGRREE